MLRRDGIFASFGGQMHLADPDVEQAVCAARAEFLADDGVPSPDGTPADSPMQWPGSELLRSDRFIDVRQSTIERRVAVSAATTWPPRNDLCLPQPARHRSRAVFDRILEVLPGQVTLVSDLTLHLARLNDDASQGDPGQYLR